jgi:uncharacterized protein (TIGR02594 family)
MLSFGQVPGNVLETAKRVALQGGPAAVSQFMASQGYPKNGNWCGEFAASVVKAAGGAPPSGAAVASNWRGLGTPTNNPQPGDIAIRRFDRSGNPVPTGSTGSHVTFVQSIDPKTGQFVGLGGNQGNFQSQYPLAGYEFRRYSPTPSKDDPFGIGTTYDGSIFGPLTPGGRAPELAPPVNVQSAPQPQMPPGLLSHGAPPAGGDDGSSEAQASSENRAEPD